MENIVLYSIFKKTEGIYSVKTVKHVEDITIINVMNFIRASKYMMKILIEFKRNKAFSKHSWR